MVRLLLLWLATAAAAVNADVFPQQLVRFSSRATMKET